MSSLSITTETIYPFFANRNLLKWAKSADTILSDINNELSIDPKTAITSYKKMIEQLSLANKMYAKAVGVNINNFYEYIDDIMRNHKIEDYNKLSNINKYKASKNLFRLTVPNYIFTFISSHREVLPKEIIDKVLPIVTNITYARNSQLLNIYIKKTLIMKLLIMNSKDKNLILGYYNYSRFLYLYSILKDNNLDPIAYNPNSGSMYFTISYSNKHQKEQIFDSIRKINKNLAPITIDEVRLYINTPIGEISQVRKLYDKRCKRYHTKQDIIDNLDHKTPNIIRKIIHELLSKYSRKTYIHSYNEMLGIILKNNIIVEDYCEKVGKDGMIFRVPLKSTIEWKVLSSKDVRKLTVNDIDIAKLLEAYKEIINPILKVISSIKIL